MGKNRTESVYLQDREKKKKKNVQNLAYFAHVERVTEESLAETICAKEEVCPGIHFSLKYVCEARRKVWTYEYEFLETDVDHAMTLKRYWIIVPGRSSWIIGLFQIYLPGQIGHCCKTRGGGGTSLKSFSIACADGFELFCDELNSKKDLVFSSVFLRFIIFCGCYQLINNSVRYVILVSLCLWGVFFFWCLFPIRRRVLPAADNARRRTRKEFK